MINISSDKTRKFHAMLTDAADISIVTHMKPDGDAMGSSIGMYHMLKTSGKKCKIVIADPVPDNLTFLISAETAEDILINTEDRMECERQLSVCDLIICLDFNAFHRTDTLQKALTDSNAQKILIDHHLNPDHESFSLVFSETEISSSCELLFHILMKLPSVDGNASNLPHESALALMTGMTTDTNNFMNSVYPSTLMMASALLEAGTDRDMILQNLYNSFSEDRIRLQGHVLKDLMHITPDGVAYVVLNKEDIDRYNVKEGDTEGFVNIPLGIKKVVMSIFAKEDGDKVRISIRSRKGISANRCARMHFNGGGHENAAGGRLYIPEDICSIEDVTGYIEKHTYTFFNRDNEQTL